MAENDTNITESPPKPKHPGGRPTKEEAARKAAEKILHPPPPPKPRGRPPKNPKPPKAEKAKDITLDPIMQTQFDEAGITDLTPTEKELVGDKPPKAAKLQGDEKRRERNKELLNHLADVMQTGMNKVDLNDAQDLALRSVYYLKKCAVDGEPPSLEGYSLSLGYHDNTVKSYLSGRLKNISPDSLEVLKNMHMTIKTYLVDSMQNGTTNPVTGIFILRNNFGMTNDDKATMSAVAETEERKLTPEEIAAKYANAPD